MGGFSYDSKFGRLLTRIAQSCYLNLLWAVCSLPIVTMGAATSALYAVTLRMPRDEEGDLTQQFFRAFRADWKQATLIWLIMVGIGALLGADIFVLLRLRSASTGGVAVGWTLALALIAVVCVAYVVELMYVFPLLARFDNTTGRHLLNALLVGTHYLFCTVLVFAIHFAMLVAVVRIFTPLIIFGEGACAVASAYLLRPVLDLCAPRSDEADANRSLEAGRAS